MPSQRADGIWISDDGQSYWNGTAWVPLATPAVAAGVSPPRRSVRWPIFVLAGCGGVLVIVVGLVVVGVLAVAGAAKTAGGCPPSDFPIPTNGELTNTFVGAYTSGNVCRLDYSDSDSGDSVEGYYRSQATAWQTTGFDKSTGTFHLRKAKLTADVQVLRTGTSSEIKIEIHS
jgi:hypothetical protein